MIISLFHLKQQGNFFSNGPIQQTNMKALMKNLTHSLFDDNGSKQTPSSAH